MERHLYAHHSSSAARHVLRVASGLDSMVLGEPQILGQVKSAYRSAREHGAIGLVLDKLFQHAFTTAKQVRTDTAIGSSPISVAFAAVSLARQIFGDLRGCTAMLLGAGETIELAARHLKSQGLGRMIVANRTLENARRLAHTFEGYAIGLDEVGAHLHEADVVIASTGSPHAILTPEQVRGAIKARKRRPVFMVDIAVPHDIDPAVGKLDDVYLYTVDDLQSVVEENRNSRHAAAREAEQIVEAQVGRFMGWLGMRGVTDTICEVRRTAETHRDAVLERSLKMIAAGSEPEQALRYLASTLTNKLMHAPTVELRRAGAREDERLVDAARSLFDLDQGAPGQRRNLQDSDEQG
jgi:glutamyl-tRNA reductase